MGDAGVQFQQTSAYPKSDSSEGSDWHWIIELDQEAFDADVPGVAKQYGLTNKELDGEAEVYSGIAISKGLNHSDGIQRKDTQVGGRLVYVFWVSGPCSRGKRCGYANLTSPVR